MALLEAVFVQLIITCCAFMFSAETPTTDVDAVSQFSENVQTSVLNARGGMLLSAMRQRIADLQETALPFLTAEDAAKSQCETNTILKMAAASTRSREVLSVLFANDTSSLLSGRMMLAWSVLDQCNQQLREELAVSKKIHPYVAALSIVAQTAQSIFQMADESLSALGNDAALTDGFYREEGGLAWRESARSLQFDLAPLEKLKRRRRTPAPLDRQLRWDCGWCIGVGF